MFAVPSDAEIVGLRIARSDVPAQGGGAMTRMSEGAAVKPSHSAQAGANTTGYNTYRLS